jgi:glycosyltransferase involved in cell wall biosynthesis
MSRQPALVSILVPSFNAARYLPEFCRSIQAQTYPYYEVLVGDDGSSDDTQAALAPFLQDKRFQLLTWRPNRGLNRGLSVLCSAMKGEYWCSPGADDLLHPSFLEKRVEMIDSNPQAVLVHGPPELIDESGAPPEHGPLELNLPLQLNPPRSLDVLVEHNVIIQPSALVRAGLTRQVLPFYDWNWAYAPDWFLWILHAATGFDLLWDARVLVKYRVHSSSLSLVPEKEQLRRAERRLVPLIALRTAAQFSEWAALSWARWGQTLYWRWLWTAVSLRSKGSLKDEWLQVAAHAYYGAKGRMAALPVEFARHVAGVMIAECMHRRAQRRQSFVVSGLAQVEDPIFR